MRPKDMTPDQQTAFRLLQRQDLKVARAWLLKERFAAFWGYTYPGAAETFAARWYWRATHSRLKPMAGVAKLIKRHLPNLLTYLTHRSPMRAWKPSTPSSKASRRPVPST
jgi:transposase